MFNLYISLALLGLAAIDPIGIGIMPLLLAQRHPYLRAWTFLSGSFVALVVMGLLFAKGLGTPLLHFEKHTAWFVPTVELVAGGILLIIAAVALLQLVHGEATSEPGDRTKKWLKLDTWHLFLVGALLVAVQSILDVVFVVAMVRAGQFPLSSSRLVAAVATYAVAALALQTAVIVAFRFAPTKQKDEVLRRVHNLLAKYSTQAVAVISLGLSILLFALALG